MRMRWRREERDRLLLCEVIMPNIQINFHFSRNQMRRQQQMKKRKREIERETIIFIFRDMNVLDVGVCCV